MKTFMLILASVFLIAAFTYLANTNPLQPEDQIGTEIEEYLNTLSAHTFQSSQYHTTISFVLPEQAFVSVKVFNSDDHMVALLVHEKRDPGIHQTIFDTHVQRLGTYRYEVSALLSGGPKTVKGIIIIEK